MLEEAIAEKKIGQLAGERLPGQEWPECALKMRRVTCPQYSFYRFEIRSTHE